MLVWSEGSTAGVWSEFSVRNYHGISDRKFAWNCKFLTFRCRGFGRDFQVLTGQFGGIFADIRRCLHELGQVVAVRHGCFEVLDGALADGELIAVRQQTVQPLQHPQQDAGTLLGQLFDEERVIHPGKVSVFHRRSSCNGLAEWIML